MFRALSAFLLALMILPSLGSRADACSCLARTPAEQYASADVVFTGRLASIDAPGNLVSSIDPVTYRFDIDRVLKGSVAANGQVQSPLSSASCGLELTDVGGRFTVFARYVDGQLSSGLCDGTHPGEADPSLPVSGTLLGATPQGPAPWMFGAAALAAAGIVLLFLVRRRLVPATA